jgi:signal transduction histidine kinase
MNDASFAELPITDPQPSALDLSTILAAWTEATDRLQKTHETLQAEVSRLTDELELKNRELARKNRLADLGQMASHIAHEVRNGLVPMKLYLSLLRRRIDVDPGSRDIVDKVLSGVTAMEATVSDLLHFSADRAAQCQQSAVQPIITAICDAVLPQLEAQGIALRLDVPAACRAFVDPDLLRRAALNLILNAIDMMPDGGELAITAVATPQGCELEIADSGPGLTDEVCARLFEPFFTTKSTGTGLGLAIVERIAAAHGGAITAANCPEGGAAFTLYFPRREIQAERMAA